MFPFVFMFLLVSSISCFVMNSWISIWVALEVNTLSFCCMMKTFSMEKKSTSESSMKYFIIQSVSSSLLIFSCLLFNLTEVFAMPLVFIAISSLMIKMGSAPFHQWFVSMVKISKWKNSTILMTWQKLAPVFLVIYQKKTMGYFFMLFSVILGSVSQMNKVSVMEIMAFSSVFNLGWMLLAISVNTKTLLFFSLVYWSSVVMLMMLVSKSKMNKINSESSDSSKKWIYFTVAINLAGIPPLAGFLAKWMVFSEVLKHNLIALVTIFLVTSSINLYIYLRFMNLTLTKTFMSKQKNSSSLNKIFMKTVFLINLFPVMMMVLYSMRL